MTKRLIISLGFSSSLAFNFSLRFKFIFLLQFPRLNYNWILSPVLLAVLLISLAFLLVILLILVWLTLISYLHILQLMTSFFGTGANRLTPGGSNPIPRGFSQWPESERLQYASKNGWFNEHEDYLANRPFVANVQFISESSTEYHGLMREFNEFRRNRKELEEKLLNIPTYSTPYMCPKKLHVESITTLLNFCTSIIFQVPTDDDD